MYYFCHMFPDILTYFINWQIVRVCAERIRLGEN
jgi:hypothetical protein